jgi:hypothetical protein
LSQDSEILAHLQAGHEITPLVAFRLCGSLACHSAIARLRLDGHDIRKEMRSENGKRFGAYRLIGQTELAL